MPFLREDLGYSENDFARVIFGYNLLYMIGQFCNGALADRFGPRLIVGIGMLTAATATFFMGFTATISGFLILNVVNGYSQATGWPGLVKLMSAWTKKAERGVLMAWWSTNYVVGGFVGTLLATWCATNKVLFLQSTWHRAFWIPAILLSLTPAVYLVFARSRP